MAKWSRVASRNPFLERERRATASSPPRLSRLSSSFVVEKSSQLAFRSGIPFTHPASWPTIHGVFEQMPGYEHATQIP